MRKKILYILTTLAATLVATGAFAQQKDYRGTINFTPAKVERQNEQLIIATGADLSDLRVRRQQMVVITPMLVSRDGRNTYDFQPIAIVGSARGKALKRTERIGGRVFDVVPSVVVVHKNSRNDGSSIIPMNLRAPYQEWMRDASLVMVEGVTGCAYCHISENQYPLMDRVLPPLFVPNYNLAYITPPVEEIKQRSENYTASLDFVVGKYEIRRDYKNNAVRLDEVDKIIKEVSEDKDLTLTEIKVTGYASPDGNYNSNMTLSKNRAQAFVRYIQNRHNIASNLVKVEWKGEDWDGLRRIVAANEFTGKDQVLTAIDSHTDITKRKNAIRAINGGQTYRYMLKEFYPQLRRNEYTVSYIARPFNLAEAKELVKTKPQYLSLNEMFTVANSYPKNSVQFKEVFDVAVRLYPDSEIANLNAGTVDIEAGAVEMGIRRLQTLNTPEAWNNMGVGYTKTGDYKSAEEFFTKAANAGNAIAKDNLRQLQLWKQNK